VVLGVGDGGAKKTELCFEFSKDVALGRFLYRPVRGS